MRLAPLIVLLALLAVAAPAVADPSPPGHGISGAPDDHPEHGPELGAARFAAQRTVARHGPSTRRLSAGGAAVVIAREVRALGDDPRLVRCTLGAPSRATCALTVVRGGVSWTGNGEVVQGRHSFRVSYEIATHA